MAFFTSFMFYRPTPPPRITGLDLARFVQAFDGLDVAGTMYLPSKVRFGAGIDADDRPSSWMKPLARDGLLAISEEIEWDVEEQVETRAALAEFLAAHDRPIYRAHLYLGSIADRIYPHVHRVGSPENERDLTPDTWSLQLEPIATGGLASEETFYVGSIGLCLGGYGYLYPWTFSEWLARAERSPDLQAVMRLCREIWPVKPARPRWRVRRGRRRMGALWPYDSVDLPNDWFWGVHETG